MPRRESESLKHLPQAAGVYCLTHRLTRKRYIGSSENIRRRVCVHFSGFRTGAFFTNRAMEDLCVEHGSDFDATVLELTTPAERFESERRLIEKHKPELNTPEGGTGNRERRTIGRRKLVVPPRFLKPLLHLAIDHDVKSHEMLALLLADALKRAQADPDSLRRVVPRKREGK